MRLANTAGRKQPAREDRESRRQRDPEHRLIAVPPRVTAPVDVLAVQHTVVADDQVALYPQDDSDADQARDVVTVESFRESDADKDQRRGHGDDRRRQVHDDVPERCAELLLVSGVQGVRAEQKQLQRGKKRGKQEEQGATPARIGHS